MKKFLFIAISLCGYIVQAKAETNKSRKPMSFYYYSSVTPQSLMDEEGKEFGNSGRYAFTANTAIKVTPQNKTIMVGEAEKNDGVIQITENDVTIDFNGKYITGSIEHDRPTAIYIANGVRNVTIKNGAIYGSDATHGFEAGIHIGHSVSNVTIENMTIRGCLGPDGAIKIEGAHNHEVFGVTLKNIVTQSCQHNNNLNIININYVHDLHLENITCQHNKTVNNGTLTVARLNNCHDVSTRELLLLNNTGSDTTTCLECISCTNVELNNTQLTNNKSLNESYCRGIKIDGSDSVGIIKLSVTNSLNAEYLVMAHRSKNVSLQSAVLTGCKNEWGSLTGILLQGTQSALIEHVDIVKSNGDLGFCGIKSEDTADGIDCKSVRCNNIDIMYNTAATGDLNGIAIKGTQNVNLSSCKIEQNKLTAEESGSINGICVAPHTKNSKDVTIDQCKIAKNSAHLNATNLKKHVAGIYLQNVQECKITQTHVYDNSGNGQFFGFYAERIPGLTMENCTAKNNKAGILGSGSTGGLDQAPTAGLYLWISDNASIKQCQFINTKAGNKNMGNSQLSVAGGTATDIIDVTLSCSGHGIINAGISPSSPNKNNTFIDCLCEGNGTQISTLDENKEATTEMPQYQKTAEGNYCWQSEATASGATEQNTKDSSYIRCKFIKNGISKHVVSYGLCMANDGTTAVCKNIEVINCESRDNGFYGFYNTQETVAAAHLIGCLSITNGAHNPIAEAVEDEHKRNFKTVESDNIPCLKIAAIDRVLIDPDKIELVNFSVAA